MTRKRHTNLWVISTRHTKLDSIGSIDFGANSHLALGDECLDVVGEPLPLESIVGEDMNHLDVMSDTV